MMRGRDIAGAVAALLLLGAGAAQAQDAHQDLAVLNGASFSNTQGNVAVNAAAGDNNQQANVAVVAKGDNSLGSAALIQILETTDGAGDRQMSALITDGAFANSSGLIAVNVAAGADNQQGNVALLSLAGAGGAMSDIVLSQSRASREPTPAAASSAEAMAGQTDLSPGAFENSSGVVQLSIIGGERNSSSNLFALSVTAGANP